MEDIILKKGRAGLIDILDSLDTNSYFDASLPFSKELNEKLNKTWHSDILVEEAYSQLYWAGHILFCKLDFERRGLLVINLDSRDGRCKCKNEINSLTEETISILNKKIMGEESLFKYPENLDVIPFILHCYEEDHGYHKKKNKNKLPKYIEKSQYALKFYTNFVKPKLIEMHDKGI